jgi:hypothetical protein
MARLSGKVELALGGEGFRLSCSVGVSSICSAITARAVRHKYQQFSERKLK